MDSDRVSDYLTTNYVPSDLIAVLLCTTLGFVLSLAAVPSLAPVQIPLGLLFVLVLPGYATTAVLFPRSSIGTVFGTVTKPEWIQDPLTKVEFMALWFGTSIGSVPLLLLALNLVSVPYTRATIMLTLMLYTASVTLAAAIRRQQYADLHRNASVFSPLTVATRNTLTASGGRVLATVVICCAVVVTGGGIAFGVTAENPETYTEFYLLSDGDNGTAAATGYAPTNGTLDVTVGLTNHEQDTARYTVVVRSQEMATDRNTTTAISNRTVNRYRLSVNHGETVERPISVTVGESQDRLQFLLYRGEAPETVTGADATNDLHLWL